MGKIDLIYKEIELWVEQIKLVSQSTTVAQSNIYAKKITDIFFQWCKHPIAFNSFTTTRKTNVLVEFHFNS